MISYIKIPYLFLIVILSNSIYSQTIESKLSLEKGNQSLSKRRL